MTWLKQFASRLTALFRKHHLECELNDELRAHIEMATEENIRRGLSRDEARIAALREFGGMEQTKELYRGQRGLPKIETFIQDLRFGMRMLEKSPGFTAAAVLTLALGIGANTAIFSLVEGILFPPFPARDAQQLVAVYTSGLKGAGYSSSSYPDYDYYRHHFRTLSGLIAYARIRVTRTVNDTTEYPWAEIVSANYFEVLDLKPVLGKFFLPQESNGATAVVSYSFWSNRLSSDARVVGRSLTINGHEFTIVGVAPKGFEGVTLDWGLAPEFWVPMSLQPQVLPTGTGLDLLHAREARWLLILGRLKPGQSFDRAAAETRTLARQLEQTFPHDDKERTAILLPLREARFWPGWRESIRRVLSLLAGAAGLVLLMACANVAGLLLGRGTARGREISLRLALGARRGRIIAQLLTEGLLLSAAGGVAGLLLALGLMRWIRTLGISFAIPLAFRLGLDGRVLAFTLAMSLISGVAFALFPALQASGLSPNDALKGSAPMFSTNGKGHRYRNALVVIEISVAFVSVIGAALFLRALWRAENTDPGFDPRGVLEAVSELASAKYSATDGSKFYSDLLDRLNALPQVQSAALSWFTPLALPRKVDRVAPRGARDVPESVGIKTESNVVSPQYFGTLKIPLLQGREFSAADDEKSPPVAIINQTMAKMLWPHQNALRRQIRIEGEQANREIIAVAADAKYHSTWETGTPYLYLPISQAYRSEMRLFVRARGNPRELLTEIRNAVRALDPQVPLFDVQVMSEQVAGSLSQVRVMSTLFGLFGGLALMLAAVGIFGVVSYFVSQRTREIGIRLALGAEPKDVLRLVMRQAFKLTAMGLGIGIIGALGLTRFMAGLLYGIEPADLLTFVSVALILAVTTLLASFHPARRATRVDPMEALRYE